MEAKARAVGQKKLSITLRFTLSAFILLILALGFNALLSLNSLEKLYVESVASQYSAIGRDLQRNLEQALRFGKSIEKFIGMEKLLKDTQSNLAKEQFGKILSDVGPAAETTAEIIVSVALPDRTILYSTETDLIGQLLPEQLVVDYGSLQEGANGKSPAYSYTKYRTGYLTTLPIRDRSEKWVATAIIRFDEAQVRQILNAIRNDNIVMIVLILAGSMVVLRLLLPLATKGTLSSRSFKWRAGAVMLLVIGGAQIFFSAWNTNSFGDYYRKINQQKISTLTRLLKEDIEFFFSKGLQIHKLPKIEVMMESIVAASPELNDITILDSHGIPLYMANKQESTNFQNATEEDLQRLYREIEVEDPAYNVRVDLLRAQQVEGTISANMSKEGAISTNLSKSVIAEKLFEIGLDAATILVISMLFFVELLLLSFHLMEEDLRGAEQPTVVVHYSMIRPIAFLFFFGIDICISFIPLHMAALYEPIFGLSKNMVMALPISMQMFFTSLSLLIAGAWVDRRGWHQPFLIGLFLSAGGFLYAWSAPNALHFIVALSLVGLGYGLSYMSAQGFVLLVTTETTKAQGLAQYYAGCLAGSLCGGAAGGMLSQRFGYAPVFIVGAVILLFVAIFTLMFMWRAIQYMKTRQARSLKRPSANLLQFFRFLTNRSMFGVIFLSSFPAAVALVGFMNYFSPIYLKQIGTSQSNIGRILMVYGLCIIYIAPWITKKIGKTATPSRYILLSSLLGACAFLTFNVLGGTLLAVAIAILFLGLSGSFNACRNSYAVNLQISQQLGEGKAMGVIFLIARLGQVAGPLVFGALLATGIARGIIYFGVAYLIISVLFLLSIEKKSATQPV